MCVYVCMSAAACPPTYNLPTYTQVRGDVLEAAWDRSWGWKKFSLFDGKATVLDDELQRKRLASMHTDQAMLDSLLCGRQHVGGTLPRQWCKR